MYYSGGHWPDSEVALPNLRIRLFPFGSPTTVVFRPSSWGGGLTPWEASAMRLRGDSHKKLEGLTLRPS